MHVWCAFVPLSSEWAASYCPDAIRMNVGSDAQKAHFLFAPCRKETKRARRKAGAATVSVAANPPPRLPEDQRPKLTDIVESELSDVEYELPELSPGSVDVANNMWPRERLFKIDNVEGYIEPGKKKPKKQREMKLTGLGMDPPERTASGWPAGSSSVLAKLAGKLDGTCIVCWYGPATYLQPGRGGPITGGYSA